MTPSYYYTMSVGWSRIAIDVGDDVSHVFFLDIGDSKYADVLYYHHLHTSRYGEKSAGTHTSIITRQAAFDIITKWLSRLTPQSQ